VLWTVVISLPDANDDLPSGYAQMSNCGFGVDLLGPSNLNGMAQSGAMENCLERRLLPAPNQRDSCYPISKYRFIHFVGAEPLDIIPKPCTRSRRNGRDSMRIW
jgi:hypothetical protein